MQKLNFDELSLSGFNVILAIMKPIFKWVKDNERRNEIN